MQQQTYSATRAASDIRASLTGKPGARVSEQLRPGHPEEPGTPHPRAVDMCEAIREVVGSEGGCSETELIARGFSLPEIVEHCPEARRLLRAGFVRQLAPEYDRVPEIIEKALVAAAHIMPRMAGVEPLAGAAEAWSRYCGARAACKLDDWIAQRERCVALLDTFLRVGTPLLQREKNRVLFAIAAELKVSKARGHA
ncbi:hypothetical protein [Aliihoeflea sp. 40Bstr573]|uniref:hypothetical protein n=1 Tax=Aliihoeflea sp. 40Bstr573 TaxID=2696467 RepID=UPI002094C91A|nr:hypothetical protein [Aliihoeflea sp. 40Bstr573]MCO6386377.1 hypothetical protein [Aliihoeflea sp. 40Bstr573]